MQLLFWAACFLKVFVQILHMGVMERSAGLAKKGHSLREKALDKEKFKRDKHLDEARELYEEALNQDADNEEALYGKWHLDNLDSLPKTTSGLIKKAKGAAEDKRYTDARNLYQVALELEPTNEDALDGWWDSNMRQSLGIGNYRLTKFATDFYGGLLKKNSGSLKIREYLAKSLFHDQKYKEAFDQYQVLVKKDPENVDFRVALAKCHNRFGEHKEAAKHLKKAYARNPNHLDLLVTMAETYNKNKNHAKAVTYADRALKRLPKPPEPFTEEEVPLWKRAKSVRRGSIVRDLGSKFVSLFKGGSEE